MNDELTQPLDDLTQAMADGTAWPDEEREMPMLDGLFLVELDTPSHR
jgi:hypothetical protein